VAACDPGDRHGVEIERPSRWIACPLSTEIGPVHLVGAEDGQAAAATLLLLRVPIQREARYATGLEHRFPSGSARFAARLPDRDNADRRGGGGTRCWSASSRPMWRTRLIQAKQALSSAAFVERYFDRRSAGARGICSTMCRCCRGRSLPHRRLPRCRRGMPRRITIAPLPGLVRRSDRGRPLTLVALRARRGERPALDVRQRPRGAWCSSAAASRPHWLWPFVADLDEGKPQVEIVGDASGLRCRSVGRSGGVDLRGVPGAAWARRRSRSGRGGVPAEGVSWSRGRRAAVRRWSSARASSTSTDTGTARTGDADVRGAQVLIRRLRACDPARRCAP